MTTPPQNMKTVIPDLRNVTLDQLTELGDTLLAHSIALYRERLKKTACRSALLTRGYRRPMNGVAALETHRLPETAFAALAAGGGDSDVIRLLCEAQQSKHTMLLHAIAGAAGDADPAEPAIAAFRAGHELITRI